MSWLAIATHDGHSLCANGTSGRIGAGADPEILCGSLVVETRLPTLNRPTPLLDYSANGSRGLHVSLQALPKGGLTLILDRGGDITHCTVNHSEAGRTDVLRLTYSWDKTTGWGRVALERTDQDTVVLAPVLNPQALRASEVQALCDPANGRYLSPEVQFLAISDAIEPVGPMPTLMPDTPVASPGGYRRAGDFKRGDVVLTGSGEAVPVLHAVSRTVPAAGCFRPLELRAPYFGLKQNIRVSALQRLVLTGSEVEYLFSREAVLVPVRHLIGSAAVLKAQTRPLVTYVQLLLPAHETLDAAGTEAASLYIGRLHRKKEHLRASILAGCERQTLPDHGGSILPVLREFEALILAEQRSA